MNRFHIKQYIPKRKDPEYEDLAKLLPLPSGFDAELNKESIIRLCTAYLQLRSIFKNGL